MLKKVVKFLLVLLLSLNVIACNSAVDQSATLGQWLNLVYEEMALPESTSEKDYFVNVKKDSEYYDAVQALVDWQILDSSIALNPQQALTKEWVAYVASNIINEDLTCPSVKDSSKSIFNKEIDEVVSLGLMSLNDQGLFKPSKKLTLELAKETLDKALMLANNPTINESKFTYSENPYADIQDDIPVYYDDIHQMALFKDDCDLKENDYVHWSDDTGEYYYQVSKINTTDQGVVADLMVPEIDQLFSDMDLESSFEVNFDAAEIEMMQEDDVFDIAPESISYTDNPEFEFLASSLNSKSFTYEGFKISFYTSGSSANVQVTKSTPFGGEMFAKASINNLKPLVKWKMEGMNVEDAFIKFDFTTTESIGFKTGNYLDLYADASKVSPDAFLSTLTKSFGSKKDVVDQVIPICKIKIPIPGVPIFNVVMQLQLHLYASGRIELTLSNTHTVGMEIKNNNMRPIFENDHKADFIIKASGNATMGLKFGVNAANIQLADIVLEGGVKGLLQSTVHIYDSTGRVNSVISDLPTDLLEETSVNNHDVLICGDLKAYWILDIVLNSSKTILGKLKLSKTFHLLNENNALLIPGMKTHIENWQFVDKCSRGNRPINTATINTLVSDQIELADYSLITHIGDSVSVQITGLPSGVSKESLKYISSDTGVATVSNGVIKGIKEGSSTITISSNDNKFVVKCNVLVTKK